MEKGHVALSGRQVVVRGEVGKQLFARGWPPVQAVRGDLAAGQRNPSFK